MKTRTRKKKGRSQKEKAEKNTIEGAKSALELLRNWEAEDRANPLLQRKGE